MPHIFSFGDLIFFACGGTRLYIQATSDEQWRPSSILYFLVDDLQAARDELIGRGITFKDQPRGIYTDEATGSQEWMTFFEDCEGNTLALMSRVSAPRV
ncbi:MAG: VOC family protein [Chloroflexi bacterium]|nr:VOC family protein [Chloroflexota bacterium]